MSSGSVPLSTSWGRVVCAWRSTRRLRQVPATAGGLSKAWTRNTTPSGRVTRPSAKGCASSRRVPEAAASRLASWRTSASSRKVISVRSRPSPRSMNTACGPLTTTSVTPSRPSTASRGPIPVASWRRRRSRSSTATSLITPASARMRRARAAASCTTSGSAAMMRCIFPAFLVLLYARSCANLLEDRAGGLAQGCGEALRQAADFYRAGEAPERRQFCQHRAVDDAFYFRRA